MNATTSSDYVDLFRARSQKKIRRGLQDVIRTGRNPHQHLALQLRDTLAFNPSSRPQTPTAIDSRPERPHALATTDHQHQAGARSARSSHRTGCPPARTCQGSTIRTRSHHEQDLRRIPLLGRMLRGHSSILTIQGMKQLRGSQAESRCLEVKCRRV